MMEELNILEANEAKSNIQLHAITQIFCVLLSIVLLSNPVFTRSAEDFLDLLHVPVAESGNTAYGKSSANAPDMEKTAANALKELDLRNPVIPGSDETCLFAEVATSDKNLMLKDNLNQSSEGMVGAVKPTLLAMLDKSNMLEAASDIETQDFDVLEIPSDAGMPIDSKHPSNMEIQTDSKRPSNMEIQTDPKHPSDLEMQIGSKHPSDLDVQIAPQNPSDIQENSKITASDVILEPTQGSAADATIQEPAVQDPLPEEVQAPKENITDSIMSEEPSNIPSAPESAEPDTADTIVPDITAPSDSETSEEEIITETPSCFLIDEAGMLCGFLPEYADIQGGCLVLPSECMGIRSGAFSGVGAGIAELYIPAEATMIEAGAFIGLDSLFSIEVESPNPMYTSINGALFDSTTTVLVSFPAGRTGAYLVPAQVTQIADNAFANTSLNRLDFRRCSSLLLGGNIFGPSSGNGIVIAVPAESLPVYGDMLSAYAVTLTK